jgi:hypothetical protein
VVALWLAIFGTIALFWSVSRGAAVLLVPYFGWVGFATGAERRDLAPEPGRRRGALPVTVRLFAASRRPNGRRTSPARRTDMSLRPLGCTALAVAITATVSAGEIRGRVLVDGKPDATVTVRALPFEDAPRRPGARPAARARPPRSRRRRREPTAPSC